MSGKRGEEAGRAGGGRRAPASASWDEPRLTRLSYLLTQCPPLQTQLRQSSGPCCPRQLPRCPREAAWRLRHHSDRGPRAVSAECPAARGPAPPLPPPQGLVALIRVSTLLFGPACRLQTGPGGHLASWGRPMGAHALRLTGELCAAESPCSGALSSWSSGPDSDPGKRSCRAPARALHTSRRKEGV